MSGIIIWNVGRCMSHLVCQKLHSSEDIVAMEWRRYIREKDIRIISLIWMQSCKTNDNEWNKLLLGFFESHRFLKKKLQVTRRIIENKEFYHIEPRCLLGPYVLRSYRSSGLDIFRSKYCNRRLACVVYS